MYIFILSVEVKNSAVFKSLKGSIEPKKNMRYSYESSLSIKSYGKKRLYKPFVSVRTPTSEVLAVGGNINHIFGKKIDYKLILDKIVKKSVVLKGILGFIQNSLTLSLIRQFCSRRL